MEAAQAAGAKVEVPKINIGFVNILGSIESAQRAERTFREAAGVVGWNVNTCDAQGDPTKMARCADSLLDQNVDVLVILGIEPSLIQAQLKKAKSQGVPVVEYSGQVAASPLWAGTYYPDEPEAGQALTDYLMNKLNELPDSTVPIAVDDYPTRVVVGAHGHAAQGRRGPGQGQDRRRVDDRRRPTWSRAPARR